MSSVRPNEKKCVNSTAAVLHGLVMPLTAVGVAAVSKKVIDNANTLLASDVKDNILHYSSIASGVANIGVVTNAFLPWLSVSLKAFNVLNTNQKALVAFTALVGLASSAYSLTQFDVPERTLEAGGFASLGSGCLTMSQAMATKFACDNNTVTMSGLLDNEVTSTGLDSNRSSYRPW